MAQQGGMRPGVQVLKAHQHTLFGHLQNLFFSRNISQNTPKMRIFFLEGRKIAAVEPRTPGTRTHWSPVPPLASGGWGFRPQTSALLLPLTDTDLSKCVSSVKTILLL